MQQCLEDYYRELAGHLSDDDDERRQSAAFLTVSVPLDGGPPEVFTIDGDLFAALFDVYLVDGWSPIEAVHTAIAANAAAEPTADGGGGTVARPWTGALHFFRFCRNMLASIVVDTLIEVERLSAARQIGQLSKAGVAVSGAISADYAITERRVRPAGNRGPMVTVYTVGNPQRLATLANLLRSFAETRYSLDQIIAVRQHLEFARIDRSGGTPTDNKAEDDARRLEEAARASLTSIRAIVVEASPLGLLILDAVRVEHSDNEIGGLLGAALFAAKDRLEGLAVAMDPVPMFLTGLPQHMPRLVPRVAQWVRHAPGGAELGSS